MVVHNTACDSDARAGVPRRPVRAQQLLAVWRPVQGRDRRVQREDVQRLRDGRRALHREDTDSAVRVCRACSEEVRLPGAPRQCLRER